MLSTFEWYVFGLLSVGIICVVTAVYVQAKLAKRSSSIYLFAVLICTSFASSFRISEILSQQFLHKFIFSQLTAFTLFIIVPLWTLFTLEYTNVSEVKKRYFKIPISVFTLFVGVALILQYKFPILLKNPHISEGPNALYTGTPTLINSIVPIVTFSSAAIGIILLARFAVVNRKTKPVAIFLFFSLISIGTSVYAVIVGTDYSITIISLGVFALGSTFAARSDLLRIGRIAHVSLYSIIDKEVLVFNSDKKLIDYNDAAEEENTYSVDENLRKNAREIFTSTFYQQFKKADKKGEVEFNYTFTPLEKEHKVKITKVTKDGTHIGYTLLSQDITSLKRTSHKLETKNRNLEEFASFISHDLRNPLNAIQGSGSILVDEIEQADSQAGRAAGLVQSSTNRMEEMIQDLELVFRESKKSVDKEEISVRRVVENARNIIKRSFEAEIHVDIDLDTRIYADKSKLQTVFENLLKNSIEHAEGDTTINIFYNEKTQALIITDDGPGFDEAVDSVFNLGVSSKGSTGLGLSIVKEMVNAHGWEIHIDEEYDGGAKFVITGVEAAKPHHEAKIEAEK